MSVSHRRVRGGTPSGEPLCRSCIHATYIRGRSQTDVLLICDGFVVMNDPTPMKFEAYECSGYSQQYDNLSYMREIAWRISVDANNRVVGFEPPKKKEEE